RLSIGARLAVHSSGLTRGVNDVRSEWKSAFIGTFAIPHALDAVNFPVRQRPQPVRAVHQRLSRHDLALDPGRCRAFTSLGVGGIAALRARPPRIAVDRTKRGRGARVRYSCRGQCCWEQTRTRFIQRHATPPRRAEGSEEGDIVRCERSSSLPPASKTISRSAWSRSRTRVRGTCWSTSHMAAAISPTR